MCKLMKHLKNALPGMITKQAKLNTPIDDSNSLIIHPSLTQDVVSRCFYLLILSYVYLSLTSVVMPTN